MSDIDLVLDETEETAPETEETAPALDLEGTPSTTTHLARQGTQGGSGLLATTHDLADTVH